jgi:hypothetical protein
VGGELLQSHQPAAFGILARQRPRDRRGEGGVDRVELPRQKASNEVEREAPFLERPHPLELLEVDVRVPGDAALPLGLAQQPLGLVEAHGIDTEPAAGGELINPQSHE